MAPRDDNTAPDGKGKETAKADSVPSSSAPQATTKIDADPAQEARLKSRRRRRRIISVGLIAALGPLIALLLGVYIYLSGGRYMVTDNAYVKSDKIVVSADISGRVSHVAVSENQRVEPGDLLFRIDQAPFRITLARAEARLAAARQEVRAMQAGYRQQMASVERARSEVGYHRALFQRQQQLSRRNLVSGLNYETAARNLRDAQDQVKVAEQALAQARAKIGGDPNRSPDDHPRVLEARALLDEAKLDVERSTVTASVKGVITNFDLQKGEYVRAGAPVFSLVGADELWVDANFKETELTHVRVGQSATVSVDTYPGKTFAATVAGISPATGAEFAVLPPQNATGNWVKVVQRLTVRLQLEEPATRVAARELPKLRAGMSAHVEIDTRHERKLGGLFSVVSSWVRVSDKDEL